jgi:serine/threonine protein kinase/tetratricopeptide (TPR) repeat protein
MTSSAPTLYGKYQLVQLLARGGMAEVFKAKSHGVEGFEKTLVIKRILPELSQNPQFVEMFINEAKIAVTLSHANIVQVFDLGRANETYFIAMEWVAGYDLATLLRRAKTLRLPLAQELAVFVVSELAKGLDYAHRRRDAAMRPLHIVHRDVSPQNVLVSLEGEVKLTDFGVAKAKTLVSVGTEAGVLKGKYAYMSPEQAGGGTAGHATEVDARTDLYALGVVLYEALSGHNPFDADSSYEILRRVRAGERAPLRSVSPDVPEELANIVERAMHPSPSQRYPHAGSLYEALVQFLYSSGRRVGGHDLSRYVAQIRDASGASRSDHDGRHLRAIFEGDSRVKAPTPIDSPSRRAEPRRHTTGVSRPAHELRDATFAVLRGHRVALLATAPEIVTLVGRYGGQLMGGSALGLDDEDEVGLLFGLRDPDGRDTEMAARCALRILHRTSSNGALAVPAIGIDARRILVDVRGEPLRDESFREFARTARAVSREASLGQVCVSASARRAIQSLFSTLPVSEDAEASHLIEAELSPLDAAGKFVGRREELRRIGELFALANRGKVRVLGIVGDAGSGKTRILHEARRRLRAAGHDVGMYVASCQRQGRNVGLSAITDLLRVLLGVDELDAPDVVRDKVLRTRELGLTAPEVGALGVLLGATAATDATDSLGRLIRPALLRVAMKLASDRLTALCFDNADAMDDESQAILDALLREGKDARLVVVLAHRLGFAHPWREGSRYVELSLEPLSDEDVARLVATRLAAEEVPVELLREVTTKSAGNPLYVEEYLKALGDTGAIEVREGHVVLQMQLAATEVPRSLRGLVASRLSRLSATDRHLLQIGALANGRFTSELLASVAGEPLASTLDAVAVLEGKGLLSRPSPSELGIAHELVGEVLRDGLTLETRREMHGAIATALEALYPQRVDEIAERLAFHHREAGDRVRASAFLVRAADRVANERPRAALQHLERAIELASNTAHRDATRLLEMYARYGTAALDGHVLAEGAEKLKAGIDLAESLGRSADIARLALLRGRILVQAFEIDEGQRWVERADEIARSIEDVTIERDATLARAEAELRRGERRRAITLLERALALCVATGDLERQLRCLTSLALAHATGGDQLAGLARIAEARDILATRPNKSAECELHTMESLVCYFARDYEKAIAAGTRCLDLAKEFQLPYHAAVSAHNIGDSYVRLNDFKRAFSSLRYSYEVARDHGLEHVQFANLRVLGYIDAMRFASPDGRAHILEAIRYAERKHMIWEGVQGRVMLAIVDQSQGAIEESRSSLREALRLAVDHGYGTYADQIQRALVSLQSGEPISLIA